MASTKTTSLNSLISELSSENNKLKLKMAHATDESEKTEIQNVRTFLTFNIESLKEIKAHHEEGTRLGKLVIGDALATLKIVKDIAFC